MSKTVVVTGAAQGIGLACAERFARDGHAVLLADISDIGEAEAERLRAAGGTAVFVRTDVTDAAQVAALMEKAVTEFGSLDILVSNAAIVHGGDFLDYDPDLFERVLMTNTKSVFLCGQAAGRIMRDQRRGSIVNMSSINAVVAMADQPAYVTSKAAVDQLTKVMALSLAPYGVRVNAVGPGTILTEFSRGAVLGSPEARAKVLARTPLGRCGEPSEVAAAVAFVASDEASYMTGQTMFLDGGRLALGYTVPVAD